ncbi:MAG: aminotransferase class IV [Dehalococcoidia bacterium]
MTFVWLDGALQPREEAHLSVDDLAVLYGAACFETMRAFGGVVFRLDRHLDRLHEGLDAIHVSPPARDVLRSAIAAALSANGLREARIRLTVTPGRGVGRPDLRAANGPTVLIVAEPAPDDPEPARVAVASLRIDEARPLAFAKTAHYLLSLLALDEARSAGCDEALLLNRFDRVAEGATSNVFAVLDGRLLTPPLVDGPLPGVTREAVLECAARLALPAGERSLTLEDLAAAEELLLTNSVVGVRSVASIAGRWFAPAAPGPITAALQVEYRRLVGRECGIEE